MKTVEAIKQETQDYYQQHHDEKQDIMKTSDLNKLFSSFIKAIQRQEYRLVCLILNEYFENAEDRAKFGNSQDEEGNSAYHHAVMSSCSEVIILLNDKSSYRSGQKFFLFTLLNKQGHSPLDLCCLRGNREVFELMWPRVGKKNHDPTKSYEFAVKGGNTYIIECLEKHPKFSKKAVNSAQTQATLLIAQQTREGLLSKQSRGPSDIGLVSGLKAQSEQFVPK